MKAVLQRVKNASVTVDGALISEIGQGLLVLLGVFDGDTERDADVLASKIANLRIFSDADDKMNLSLLTVGGEMLVVSQFTLYGDCRRGKRPSFSEAARPELANGLYEKFVEYVKQTGVPVQTGVFQTMMAVSLVNDGPVTLIIDTPEKKS